MESRDETAKEDHPETSESSECSPDFSHLPSVAWVKVMSELSLHDRYMVSQTCHTLHDSFSHPSLWHTMSIHLLGAPDNWTPGEMSVPEKYVQMVSKYGRFFQNLTISVTGFLNKDFGTWNDVLSEVSKRCRLESLSLEVGNLTNRLHLYGLEPENRNIIALVGLVKNAFRMKSFHLYSWPIYESTTSMFNLDENIFQALVQNPRLQDLESLSLFWSKKPNWTERKPLLVPPLIVLEIVQHFRNLSHLALRSPMINESVLAEFCSKRDSRLNLLQIYVNYYPNSEEYEIPEIPPRLWETLTKVNPNLAVEMTVMSRVPDIELYNLLSIGCPLTAIKFLKYARCDNNLVSSLCEKYKKTLHSFTYDADWNEIDDVIIKLVFASKYLVELKCSSPIRYKTVIQLAKMRGALWKTFAFENVTLDDEEGANFGDDEVIARGEDGQYVLVGMVKFHKPELGEEERETRYRLLCEEVSKSLGYSWTPGL